MINELIYVYCISDRQPELGKHPDFEGLRCILTRGIFTVVKMVPNSEFSEENLKKNLSDLGWLDTNAREHIRTISLLMEDYNVIPFNFGTIYNSQDSLLRFLEDYYDSLIEKIEYISGKEEWGIKMYFNRTMLIEQIDELSMEAADLEKQIMASSPGKAFLLRRKKSELIESEMNRLTKSYGQDYFNQLKKISEATMLNNLLPKELTGRDDTMILNASFLLYKDKASDFTATLNFLREKCVGFGFDIEFTGPWPPFSFISIKEKV